MAKQKHSHMSDSAQAEFADTHQASLYDEIKDKPLHVEVVVLHKGRTQQHVIERELLRVLKGHSLDEIKEQLLETQEALEALNIFQAVELTLEPSRNAHAGTYLAETEGDLYMLSCSAGPATAADTAQDFSMPLQPSLKASLASPALLGMLRGLTSLWSVAAKTAQNMPSSLPSPEQLEILTAEPVCHSNLQTDSNGPRMCKTIMAALFH